MRLRDKRIKEKIDKGEVVCVKKSGLKLFLTLNTYDEVCKRLGRLANGGWEILDEKPFGCDFL